jgi:hypothetical protein
MDPTVIILLAKIVSDLIVIVTMGIRNVEGLTEEQKQETLATLQTQTATLVAQLQAMSVK